MIQVAFSDQIAERLQEVAVKRHTDVKSVVEEAVEFYFAHATEPEYDEEFEAWEQAQQQIIEREMQHYLRQHQQLLSRYRGQYIAMLNGEMVDHDADEVALSQRVRARYGQTTLLITPVLPEPIQKIALRSPHVIME